MSTTPRNIRFDDDLYEEVKAIAKRPLTTSWHIQEATRQYLKKLDKPVLAAPSSKGISPVPIKGGWVELEAAFDDVWNVYGKKGNKKTSKAKYLKLSSKDRETLSENVGAYVLSTPDKQYRKNFETYINQEVWNDEVNNNEVNNGSNQQRKLSVVERVRAAADERERARQARSGNGQAMGEISGGVRTPATQPVRGNDTGELGAVIDGDCTRTD